MKMRAVSSPHVREPKPETWSNCKVHGDHVYISGMTAHDLDDKLFEFDEKMFRRFDQ